ncbi:uncharacterized protein BDR25DRAFT_319443 [Lindgomyces ingoldianus]|uniref:Uncharacterized protein n=1 Tax=Lindgomyces ingoldianus TaxID=673940 RepID=A0ACB6QC49_9PLEO|nr:uncharacterized protein BDR25DRAFT_319443 [Lindgomyces ingoldianus]KAF2464183.1 hypothetical protein BDR25DRAFT_319443 [Lindgomyces ingoldianus]
MGYLQAFNISHRLASSRSMGVGSIPVEGVAGALWAAPGGEVRVGSHEGGEGKGNGGGSELHGDGGKVMEVGLNRFIDPRLESSLSQHVGAESHPKRRITFTLTVESGSPIPTFSS